MREVLARLRSFWRGLTGRKGFEADLQAEFRLHVELRAEDLMRSGVPAGEAVRRARREFGSVDRYKDEARAARGLRLVDELWADLRYATRYLRRRPVFSLAATLTLALGVGVNAAVFAVVNGTVLAPVPYEAPDRLLTLYQMRAASGSELRTQRWAYPEYEAVRAALTSIADLSAYYADEANLASDAIEPVRVGVETVSGSYFRALRLDATVGRLFLPEEDSIPGSHPVAVLGHGLWQERFGAVRDVAGTRIELNGVQLHVVGVAPRGFRGLSGEADVWIPMAMAPAVVYADQLTTMQHFLSVIGRLQPDATLDRARAEVRTTGLAAAAAAREERGGAGDDTWRVVAERVGSARRDPEAVRASLVLAGAAGFVLLIALVNLTGLFLAQAAARARETAVRKALGAGNGRLLRQDMAGSALLGVTGGAAGALLAVWTVHMLRTVQLDRIAGAIPAGSHLAASGQPESGAALIVFALLLAVVTSALAGAIPNLRASAGRLGGVVSSRGEAKAAGSLRRPTLLSAAAIAQVAFALVLLTGAGQLLQAFHRLRTADPGFQPDRVLSFRITAPSGQYRGGEAALLLERILENVDAVPGVQSATVSFCLPFTSCSSTFLHVEGRSVPDEEAPLVGRHYVGAAHFRTLGIKVLSGRGLSPEDRAGRPRVAVINETAARRLWPGEDPIGRRVRFTSGGGFASPDSLTEIVGIVADVQYGAPGTPILPDFYTSYLQFTWPSAFIAVRSSTVDPLTLVPALRRAVAAADPALPIHDVRLLDDRRADALTSERFSTLVLGAFALLGLLLASVGVYGVMAYSVAQRRRELGIRLALGATPEGVVRFVSLRGLSLAGAGLVIGAFASLALSPVLPALIPDVRRIAPDVLVAASAVLLLVATLACILPARTAARIDPLESIASE